MFSLKHEGYRGTTTLPLQKWQIYMHTSFLNRERQNNVSLTEENMNWGLLSILSPTSKWM